MRSVTDVSRQELEQFLTNEIASARSEARPISRLTLSRMVQSQFGVNPHEAERMVDNFCEDKAPGVPTYLSSEFGVPYLKVLAIVNTAVALGLAITTAVMMSRGGHYLIWLGVTVFFIAMAAFTWVQSERPQKKVGARVSGGTGLPNVAPVAETTAEPATTGSFPSRS